MSTTSMTKSETSSASESVVLARLAEPGIERREHRALTHRLCKIATGASVPRLRELFASDDRPSRLRAVLILSRWQTEAATECLVAALQSPHTDVVGAAARHLATRKTRDAVPALVNALETHAQTPNRGDLSMVVRALVLLPHRSAVPALAAVLKSPQSNRRERKWAARGLAAIRAPESRAALENAVDELGWLRGRYPRKLLKTARTE
jgi:HEAT repeat protein